MKILQLLLASVTLTNCASRSPTVADSMQLYSPQALHLKAGTVIQTSQGQYQCQTDEVWHSHAEYMKAVRESLRP